MGEPGDVIEVETERMATGGEAVGRLGDGRVVFVRGALAGERTRVQLTEQRKRFVRGRVVDVLEPGPDRIEPACRHARSGACGGCDWMHVAPDAQRRYKLGIVVEQLRRLGGLDEPSVRTVDHEPGTRTTVRCAVTDGRAGYRARRSEAAFVAQECRAAHPLLEELIVGCDFGDATEVTLRVAAATGERLVVTDGSIERVRVPPQVQDTGALRVVSDSDPGDAAIVEHVAGRPWRISAKSFFQTSHTGAEALVDSVARRLGGSGSVVDLYAGVGLLGGAAVPDRLACAVESNPSSVADARHNLGDDVQVVQSRVERWKAESFDAVIADPARRGLGADGVAVVERTGADALVLVSCDPASLGRDTALLVEQGWRHDGSDVIDMFPDTSRIEVVSGFTR